MPSEDPLADECDLKRLEAAEGVGWVRSGKSTCGKRRAHLVYPARRLVQKAEISRKTVIEYAPESNQAAEYDALAARVEDNAEFCIPTPSAKSASSSS